MNRISLPAICILIFSCLPASGTTVFFDDFSADGNTIGTDQLNFNAFNQFSVSEGTVDLISENGGFGISCVTSYCVDLDGSTSNAGVLTSNSFSLDPSLSYTLTFVMSGNQRGSSTDTVAFGINNAVLSGPTSLSFGGTDPFTTFSYEFSVPTATSGSVFFANEGGDNIGAILDSVLIESSEQANGGGQSNNSGGNADPDEMAAVPVPATGIVFGVMLAAITLISRRGSPSTYHS